MDTNPGNKYKSLALSIVTATTDYSVAENNITEFPDWSSDWEDRDWYNVLVIKGLTKDAPITIKFHRTTELGIIIRDDETPAIIDNIAFRDVFISNASGITAEFDIMFFSPDTLIGEPRRPTDLALTEITGDVVMTFVDNTNNENEFSIERSTTSATTGFTEIDTTTFSNFGQKLGKTRTYSDTTVSGSTQYWYRIRSVRGGLDSAASNVEEITTI